MKIYYIGYKNYIRKIFGYLERILDYIYIFFKKVNFEKYI